MQSEGGSGTERRGRVLLVDDEPEILRLFQRVLERAGYRVTTAQDGEGAIAALDREVFDVVLSDIRLPSLSGVDLLRAVRDHDLDVPVVLITGWPDVETATQAVELGALQYLSKPIAADQLLQVVQRAVRLSAIARVKREAMALHGELRIQAGDRAGLMSGFERALRSLTLAYQPIVDAGAREVFAYEALLRSGEPALPDPESVISAAERLGRLDELGVRTRELATSAIDSLPEGALLFINLRASDLVERGLASAAAPLSTMAARVVLEITEREAIDDPQKLRAHVTRVRALGYQLALDDLGAGYAGLTSFAILEPDYVKLDRTLVTGCQDSPMKKRLIGLIAELCREMEIRVIAEGVETVEERDALLELGCDYLQGYLFARPACPFPEVTWPDP